MARSILVVDDESGIRQSLTSILEEEGYRVEAVGSGEECLATVAARPFDLILLDVWLPGMDGLVTLERLQQSVPAPMVVMISGHGNIETAVRATKLGAFDFVEKPLSLEKTILVVKNALEYLRLEEENRGLRAELEQRCQVIGESVPMKALRQQIALAAPTNGRVLIYGESGTGKELVARALHAASLRRDRPLVEVNCAAIPEELIESELFGHLKGSFTGASEDKVGKFQKADMGTLFLDEVGDMSLKTQSKVLRVLEEQRFEPVGSNQAVDVDVRVIAATNKTLEGEIARGAFREDLFYRLNVIPFYVSPLRERIEDLPILARYFLAEFSGAYGRKVKELSEGALDVLMRHPWPGNVRELSHVIERAVLWSRGPTLDVEHLSLTSPDHDTGSAHHGPPAEAEAGAGPPTLLPQGIDLAQWEKAMIERAMRDAGGNQTRAAQRLGISRDTLRYRLKKFGLQP